MMVDLVVLNAHPSTYLQELADRITAAVYAIARHHLDRPAGRRVRAAEGSAEAGRAAHAARHRAGAHPLRRPLAGQDPGDRDAGRAAGGRLRRSGVHPPGAGPERLAGVARGAADQRRHSGPAAAPLTATPSAFRPSRLRSSQVPRTTLRSTTASAASPPTATTRSGSTATGCRRRPGSNVIANRHGGFVVTERGGGFTWAENSYFYRLTPWHNDPVSDPVSEVHLPPGRGDRRAVVRHAGPDPGGRAVTPCATAPARRPSSTSTAASPPTSRWAWRRTRRSRSRCCG